MERGLCNRQGGISRDRVTPRFSDGDYKDKQNQEQWKGGSPISLVHFGNPGTNPLWAGTLTALPTPKAKLLLVHSCTVGDIFATSYNEIAPTGDNQDMPGHHVYDQSLVSRLLSVPASGPNLPMWTHSGSTGALPVPVTCVGRIKA